MAWPQVVWLRTCLFLWLAAAGDGRLGFFAAAGDTTLLPVTAGGHWTDALNAGSFLCHGDMPLAVAAACR